MTVSVSYDSEIDVFFASLGPGKTAWTHAWDFSQAGTFLLDFDESDHILHIEIHAASQRIIPELLARGATMSTPTGGISSGLPSTVNEALGAAKQALQEGRAESMTLSELNGLGFLAFGSQLRIKTASERLAWISPREPVITLLLEPAGKFVGLELDPLEALMSTAATNELKT